MSKRSALDKAIQHLEEKRAAILAKANMEVQAMDHAILSLQAQNVSQLASRPRPVAAVGDSEKVG